MGPSLNTAQSLPAVPAKPPNRCGQLDDRTLVKTSPQALFCELDGQVIVLHRDGRVCYALGPLATLLWKRLSPTTSLDDLRRLAPQLRRDEIVAWITRMVRYGLLEVDPVDAAGSRQVDVAELRRVAYAQHLLTL